MHDTFSRSVERGSLQNDSIEIQFDSAEIELDAVLERGGNASILYQKGPALLIR
jgi:hypothetical protein